MDKIKVIIMQIKMGKIVEIVTETWMDWMKVIKMEIKMETIMEIPVEI
jgi:hypothetical protein